MSGLEFTGERFIPGERGPIWIEHWHRYHFAAPWARGRRVLDVACGEGYGSALLARSAADVVGVDVSPAAIAHATSAYAGVPNLRFLQGSATGIPLPDASVDLAVSFETIEHIEGHEAFIAELARVLTPEGVLLLSSPDKAEYSERRGFSNEFHVRELYREELASLLASRFPHATWFGQRPTFYSVIAPAEAAAAGTLATVGEEDPSNPSAALPAPLYHLVAASRSAASLQAVPPTLHVLADRGDWVWRDYEKVMKWMEQAVADRDRLQRELAERDKAIAAKGGHGAGDAPRAANGIRAWISSLLK